MLPKLNPSGLLPPGTHAATWAEVVQQFGNTPHRMRLLTGLRSAASVLKAAGCRTLYLDGSFVTDKRIPADYDACWDPVDVVLAEVDPVLKTFSAGRAAQKTKYGGEFFPSTARAGASGITFLEFFQKDRDGNPKGVITLDLRSFET